MESHALRVHGVATRSPVPAFSRTLIAERGRSAVAAARVTAQCVGRHTGAGNDLGSSDLEVLHVGEGGNALAAGWKRCLHHAVVRGEDHSVYRGQFLEACRVGGGGLALGRGERGAQFVHRVPFQFGDQVIRRAVES